MDKFNAWCLKHPNTFVLLLCVVTLSIGIILGRLSKKEDLPKIQRVESWASNRYHFVNMRSMTDEVYTMICDRHTGIESLLAKAYKYPREDSRDGGNISTMTSIHMGFNPDCINRDINAYENRRRTPLK